VVKAQRVSEAIAGLAVKPVLYLYSGQERELSQQGLKPLLVLTLLAIAINSVNQDRSTVTFLVEEIARVAKRSQ
jgi:hypothetical protein